MGCMNTKWKGWPRLLYAQGADASDVRYATGFAAQGLWHWQDCELYGRLFGYSVFDPFFTLGARGWLGDGIGIPGYG